MENQRLKRSGRSPLSLSNQMLWFTALPFLFAAALAGLFGRSAILFFFAQSFIAIVLLEVVNYLEHYGLARQETSPGRYEKVSPAHSWNANHRLTNYLLFKLQRHADHHLHSVKRYQTLRHFAESPQLPTGYAGMVLLALVPPLWRRIMHARLAGVNGG
ncbi:MAG: fatty acid desaturase [bacterium]